MSEIPTPPPPIDSGSLGYVKKEKISTRSSTTKSKAPKKKVKNNNSLSDTQDIKAKLSNVNLQVDEDLLASFNSSSA